jgi:cysteine desulfurase
VARAYLDHASTSTLRPAARDAMAAWLDTAHGDPGRIHAEGMAARVAVEEAREHLAALVGARPREVVFTSGATEAIAAATYGALGRDPDRRRVLCCAVEHSAVRQWSERGEAVVVGVGPTGRVDSEELLAAVDGRTALVHVQWGNHEVATLQPVAEVVAGCRERGVLVHVDAAQAVGRVPVDLGALGADLVSLSGHKFGGPTGTGALVVRRGVRVPPLLLGGDQERARRAGMENVLGVVGLGAAAAQVAGALDDEHARSRLLTERLVEGALRLPGVVQLGDPVERLPHLVCLGLEGVEPQPVLLGLDRAGVAVHSGSSCSSEALEPSPVLAAMGADAERSLRISVGWDTTDDDVDRCVAELGRVLAALRSLAGD